jgi:dTDP-4-amino-4,6-dideoxygalactose transaminase
VTIRRIDYAGSVHDEREIEAVVEVLRTSNLNLGPKVAAC